MRRISILVSMLVALFALVGCGERFDFNEKLTVSVETPAGEISGTGITNIKALVGKQLMTATEIVFEMTGEATVVDLGSGKYLFALLNGVEYRAEKTWYADAKASSKQVWRSHLYRTITASEGKRVLRGPQPMLVTFEDIADPQSVKLVDPANLAATFGEGYALISITLEITDEPVTEGKVEKLLPWLIDAGRTRYSVVELPPNPGPTELLAPEQRIELNGFLTSDHWREE